MLDVIEQKHIDSTSEDSRIFKNPEVTYKL